MTSKANEMAPLATHLVLYEHVGEDMSRHHFEALGPWRGQVDLSELRLVGAYRRRDGQVPFPRYLVRRVGLPAWLGLEEWLGDRLAWATQWAFGMGKSWPESWQRFLVRSTGPRIRARYRFGLEAYPHSRQLALIELRCARATTVFYRSLLSQADAWIQSWWDYERQCGPAPTFLSPLSERQWSSLERRHHHRESQQLYRQLMARPFLEEGEELADEEALEALGGAAA